VLTALSSRPHLFQLAPNFKEKMALGFARTMTVVSGMITTELAVSVLYPHAGPLIVLMLLLIFPGVVFYAIFTSLVSAYEEGHY